MIHLHIFKHDYIQLWVSNNTKKEFKLINFLYFGENRV